MDNVFSLNVGVGFRVIGFGVLEFGSSGLRFTVVELKLDGCAIVNLDSPLDYIGYILRFSFIQLPLEPPVCLFLIKKHFNAIFQQKIYI